MSRKEWKHISELFHATLERPPNERKSFLKDACKGDQALLKAVERLIEADSEASGFMEESLVRLPDSSTRK
jgi:hypothetical protein